MCSGGEDSTDMTNSTTEKIEPCDMQITQSGRDEPKYKGNSGYLYPHEYSGTNLSLEDKVYIYKQLGFRIVLFSSSD